MAKFSRAHYVLIADAIATTQRLYNPYPTIRADVEMGLETLQKILIGEFKKDNPRFDSIRFKQACTPKETL